MMAQLHFLRAPATLPGQLWNGRARFSQYDWLGSGEKRAVFTALPASCRIKLFYRTIAALL